MRVIRNSNGVLFVGLIVWLAIISGGLYFMLAFAGTPGAAAAAPPVWPVESLVERAAGTPTLLMTVHPHCPCSRASLDELEVLMNRQPKGVDARVLFVTYDELSEDEETLESWNKATRIPGVRVYKDQSGVEARRFGARTSGQVLLYDADGRLLFNGGITVARGHRGDSQGRSAIEALLTGSRPEQDAAPVFGCPLFDAPSTPPRKEFCHANSDD